MMTTELTVKVQVMMTVETMTAMMVVMVVMTMSNNNNNNNIYNAQIPYNVQMRMTRLKTE